MRSWKRPQRQLFATGRASSSLPAAARRAYRLVTPPWRVPALAFCRPQSRKRQQVGRRLRLFKQKLLSYLFLRRHMTVCRYHAYAVSRSVGYSTCCDCASACPLLHLRMAASPAKKRSCCFQSQLFSVASLLALRQDGFCAEGRNRRSGRFAKQQECQTTETTGGSAPGSSMTPMQSTVPRDLRLVMAKPIRRRMSAPILRERVHVSLVQRRSRLTTLVRPHIAISDSLCRTCVWDAAGGAASSESLELSCAILLFPNRWMSGPAAAPRPAAEAN